MAITNIDRDGQFLIITEDGKTYRRSIRFVDTIVSAIVAGQYTILNEYYRVSDGHIIVEYTDGTSVYSLDLSSVAGVSALADLTDVNVALRDDRDLIRYDAVSGKWLAKVLSSDLDCGYASTRIDISELPALLHLPIMSGGDSTTKF